MSILENEILDIEFKYSNPYIKSFLDKLLAILLIITSTILLICNTICLRFWYKAYLHLGYVPTYNNPDPKNLGWFDEYHLVEQILDILLITLIAWILLAIIVGSKTVFQKARIIKKPLLLFCAFCGLFSIYLIFGDFFEWFID
jgi:hypothetical protein